MAYREISIEKWRNVAYGVIYASISGMAKKHQSAANDNAASGMTWPAAWQAAAYLYRRDHGIVTASVIMAAINKA